MSESEHNPFTQPAAAGGHNLQPRRGWLPPFYNDDIMRICPARSSLLI